MKIKEINPKKYGMARFNEKGKLEILNYQSDEKMWSKETEQKAGRYRKKLISNRSAEKWWYKHREEEDAQVLPF